MVKNIFKRLLNIKALFFLILLLNLGVVFHIFQAKQGFHSDEQWSYAHANSSKGAYLDSKIDSFFQIDDGVRQRLFNHWVEGKTFNEYLTVQTKERFSYRHIYDNLKVDVHPPLYFILLHTVCSFFPDSFSKWYAGSINIVLFVLIYLSLFKLSKLLLNDSRLALCCVALWGFSEIGLDTVVFLRMYILQTLFSVCLMYEAIKIAEGNKASKKQLFLCFLYSFFGVLTQYNSIFFSFFVTLITCLILLKHKNYRLMFCFGGVMALSVVMLFVVFPPAYEVLLGSLRGKQVLSAFQKMPAQGNSFFDFLWLIDLKFSQLIDMFALHFFAFHQVNYQLLAFFIIIGISYKYLFKCQNRTSTNMLLSVTALYCLYLLFMPYMGIFHSRYFMNIAPFIAILAVMLISNILRQAKLKPTIIVSITGLLVVINSLRLNFSTQSPYAFLWGEQESKTALKIKNNDVFIDAGQDVIALHSMVYYLKQAKRVYITEDICENKVLSDISDTKNPIILTYSSYMLSSPSEGRNACLKNVGFYKTAVICPSQRCYGVWQKIFKMQTLGK